MSEHQVLPPEIRRVLMRWRKPAPRKKERLERTAADMRSRRIAQPGRGSLPMSLRGERRGWEAQ